ncbi:MAG: GNAT family N-acetyltransferase [Polyangiaceae bacterium]|nr:GNAT family N-acetyltransferase [Polyangiaceae bacterium]
MSQPAPLPIVPAHVEHARAFATYVVEHVAESGRGGAPHFAVSSGASRDEIQESAIERWVRRLDQPLWGRAWLLWTRLPSAPGPARVAGHIELRGGRVKAELHRAVLAMGLLAPQRGQGHGRRLLDAAIAWARDEAGLDYIDLGVFVGNDRARRLYERAGFVAQGVRRDAFRLDGDVVDDIQMTLDLHPPPG